jgi:penicillin-binding protein 2
VQHPGSIFKIVSAIAGLETGVITVSEKIRDVGVYPYGHNPACWIWNTSRGAHGWLNVSDAIKKSCNYFFYEVGRRMGIENLEKYSSYFGLGKKTGIELTNETSRNTCRKDSL